MLLDVAVPQQLQEIPSAVIAPASDDYSPKISGIRHGFEASSMDFNGVRYAAIGFKKGGRAIGVEIGHKFRETIGGFRTGVLLTSYYNWVKDSGDTELKYIMAQEKRIGHDARALYDVAVAYNLKSGAYASATVKREFPSRESLGILHDITPYVSATISDDRERANLRFGVTSVVDIGKGSHARFNLYTQFKHDKATLYLTTSLRFK